MTVQEVKRVKLKYALEAFNRTTKEQFRKMNEISNGTSISLHDDSASLVHDADPAIPHCNNVLDSSSNSSPSQSEDHIIDPITTNLLDDAMRNSLFQTHDSNVSTPNFSDHNATENQYLPSTSTAFPSVPCTETEISSRKKAMNKLQTIFTVNGATTKLRNEILQFIRSESDAVLKSLPLDYRTLRSAPIDHDIYNLPPGQMIYFGIENILTLPGVTLFDHNKNEIRLSTNIDGLPLFHDPNGVGFWPILCAIDRYPVFLIALYCGKKKPHCPNAFLRPFVKEVRKLQMRGMLVKYVDYSTNSLSPDDKCGVKVYRFRLYNMVLDAPALCFITCIKGHSGNYACPKCTESGQSVILKSMGLRKDGEVKKGVRYTKLHKAAPRTHRDFRVFLKYCQQNRLNTGHAVTDCCKDYSAVRNHYGEGGSDDDDIFQDVFEKDKMEYDEEDDEEYQLANNEVFMKELKEHHIQKYRFKNKLPNPHHVSILTTVQHFDIVQDVPTDYMYHFLGVVMNVLQKLTSVSLFKMDEVAINRISSRLLFTRDYFPREFQRKPESLSVLSSWKASQVRSFLLYVGVVVFRGILSPEKLEHFYILVTAGCLLTCRVDDTPNRPRLLADRGRVADALLHEFVKRSIKIYGCEIATIKMHELLHVVDDYLRFGPLDMFSAFRFESFLGKLKNLIGAHKNPAAQVINAYSSLLQTGTFGVGGDRGVHVLEEYYEEPQLWGPYHLAHTNNDAFFKCGQPASKHTDFATYYKRMYLKSFCISAENDGDSCCVVDGNTFLKVREILKDNTHNRILLCGNTFTISGPLYQISIPNESGGDTFYNSDAVGAVLGCLTQNTYMCEFSSINQKVCAIPIMENDEHTTPTVTNMHALLRFLH